MVDICKEAADSQRVSQSPSVHFEKMSIPEGGVIDGIVMEEIHPQRKRSNGKMKDVKFSTVDLSQLDCTLGKPKPSVGVAIHVEAEDSSTIPLVVPSLPSPELAHVEKVEEEPMQSSITVKEEPRDEDNSRQESSRKEYRAVDLGVHRDASELRNSDLQNINPQLAMDLMGHEKRLKVGGLWKNPPEDLPKGVIWRSPNCPVRDQRTRKILEQKPVQGELVGQYNYLIGKLPHHAECPCLNKVLPKKCVKKERKQVKKTKMPVKKGLTARRKCCKRGSVEADTETPVGEKRIKIEDNVKFEREPQSTMMVYRHQTSPLSSHMSESDVSFLSGPDILGSPDHQTKLDPAVEEMIVDAIHDENFPDEFEKSVVLESANEPNLVCMVPNFSADTFVGGKGLTNDVNMATSLRNPMQELISDDSVLEFPFENLIPTGTVIDLQLSESSSVMMENPYFGSFENSESLMFCDGQTAHSEDLEDILSVIEADKSTEHRMVSMPEATLAEDDPAPVDSELPEAIATCLAFVNGSEVSYPESELLDLKSCDMESIFNSLN